MSGSSLNSKWFKFSLKIEVESYLSSKKIKLATMCFWYHSQVIRSKRESMT